MNISNEWQAVVLILSAVFVNWPLIFGLSVHIDSWIICRWLHDNDHKQIREFYNNVGIPLMAPLIIFLWKLSGNNLHLSGFVVLSLRVGHSLAVYMIFKDLLNFASPIAFIITLLTIIYPSQTYLYDFVVGLLYGISWPLFTIGSTLYFSAHIFTDENWIRIVLVFLSTILILLSFNMKSILLLALVLNLVVLNSSISVWPEKNSIDFALKFFMTILPIIYWITIERFYPRKNAYKNYNKFLPLSQILKVVINLVHGTSIALFGGILQAAKLFKHPDLYLPLIIILILNKAVLSNESINFAELDSSTLFTSGVAICFVALIPYALVSQEFDFIGYLTKNFILCDVSCAIVVSSIFLMFFPTAIPLNILFIFISVVIIYNFVNQCKLWIFYAKQCEIRQVISEIKTEIDIALTIEDLSSWTKYGKKDRFYPMTINFMANTYSQSGLISYSPSKSKRIQDILDTAAHHYNNEALPTLKKNYNPKQIIQLRVEDNIITVKNLCRFIFSQFRKDPFDLQSSPNMFTVTTIYHRV